MHYEIWMVAGGEHKQRVCNECSSDSFTKINDKDLPTRMQAVCKRGHKRNFRATPPNRLELRKVS